MNRDLMKKLCWVIILTFASSLFAMTGVLHFNGIPAQAAGNNGLVGVNLADGLPFVDAAKTMRVPVKLDGTDAALDSRGYAQSDFKTVFFDYRPTMAWAPPIDDPDGFQLDMSGTYKLSFKGQAALAVTEGNYAISNKVYDSSTNTTTADVVVPAGSALVGMSFTGTKRLAADAPGTGVTDIKMIRPGYAANTTQTFTDQFKNSLAPFSTLRSMDWTSTNNDVHYYGDPVSVRTRVWADRRLTTDATQENHGRHFGFAWEYIIQIANETGKDLWINIPVSADDNYVTQLATLMKNTLNTNSKVYVEYGNEVWNWSFQPTNYNQMAAEDEVARGGSALNNDGNPYKYDWGRRRYAKRGVEISNLFKNVFGVSAMNSKVRVVYAWQIDQATNIDGVLSWVNSTYGTPSQYFYSLAVAPYYNYYPDQYPSATVTQVIAQMRQESDNNVNFTKNYKTVSTKWNLQFVTYEGGPSTGSIGSSANVANIIRANRDAGIKDLLIHDVQDNWWNTTGGGLYMFYYNCGYYSRFGCWGLTEDSKNTNTYKYQAVNYLVTVGTSGSTPTPAPTATPTMAATATPTPTGAATATPTPSGSGAKLTGTPFGNNTGSGNAFDGNTGTYYSGGTSGYVGLDLGSGNAKKLTKVRFYPRYGTAGDTYYADRASGTYQGSNDNTSYTALISVPSGSINYGAWNEIICTNANTFRYFRLMGTPYFTAEVAEIEFYSSAAATATPTPRPTNTPTPQPAPTGAAKLTGTSFGNTGGSGNAFDGNTGTFYAGGTNGYAGLDLGSGNTKKLTKVRFYPRYGSPGDTYYADRASGTYQGSNDNVSYTDLAAVNAGTIAYGQWNEVVVSNNGTYRYFRLKGSQYFTTEVAEIEFYGQ